MCVLLERGIGTCTVYYTDSLNITTIHTPQEETVYAGIDTCGRPVGG